MNPADWNKYEWYTFGIKVERVTKTFKFQMLDYIRNCANIRSFNSFTPDIQKILLGLYIEGLPSSQYKEIPDYWANNGEIMEHYIKHLVAKRNPSIIIDSMTDILLAHYNESLSLLFYEIQKNNNHKRLV